MNGATVFVTGLAAAAVIGGAILSPSLIQAKEVERLRSTCWSQDAKQSFNTLSAKVVKEQLLRAVKSGGGGLSQADIAQATTINADGFHTISVDEKSGSVSCAATVDFVFKRRDGKLLQNAGTVVGFEVHPSGMGQVVSITRGEIFRNIIEAAQTDD